MLCLFPLPYKIIRFTSATIFVYLKIASVSCCSLFCFGVDKHFLLILIYSTLIPIKILHAESILICFSRTEWHPWGIIYTKFCIGGLLVRKIKGYRALCTNLGHRINALKIFLRRHRITIAITFYETKIMISEQGEEKCEHQ